MREHATPNSACIDGRVLVVTKNSKRCARVKARRRCVYECADCACAGWRVWPITPASGPDVETESPSKCTHRELGANLRTPTFSVAGRICCKYNSGYGCENTTHFLPLLVGCWCRSLPLIQDRVPPKHQRVFLHMYMYQSAIALHVCSRCARMHVSAHARET